MFFGNFQGTTYSIDVFSLNAKIDISEADAFIRTRLTYVGLSIIGFSTIVFKIVCPSQVSLNRSMREYVQTSIEITFPSHAKAGASDIARKRWYDFAIDERISPQSVSIIDVDGSRATKIRTGGADRSLERTEWLESNQNALNYIFSRKYEQADASVILARIVVALGYAVGFVLLLIPSVTVFWPQFKNVLRYFGLIS